WATQVGGRDRAVRALEDAGLPAGPVRAVRDVARTEPARSRGSFAQVPDPVLGTLTIVNTPFKMSYSRVGPERAAPALGADTEPVAHFLAHRSRKQNT
ncbi:MAG TPA: CoA transferase, partial [Microbacteriaceae bacterium]|nr:CoA transferase [Microbacteriaceae bacterium]